VKSLINTVLGLSRKEKIIILLEYVTAKEVGKVYAKIGLDDWSEWT
jgi:hypothetical protein